MMEQNRGSAASRQLMAAYGYMALWIALSASVIMLNKYILDPTMGGFPFPLTLTSLHMLFCSVVSWLLVRLQLIEAPPMPVETYLRSVVPIGALFATTLWMGNAAYLHLSVSFIQMIKAVTPLLVYVVGTMFGTEKWCLQTGIILIVVVGGVLTASYGEVVFVLAGVLFQCASMVSEATRLTLVQILLQGRGIKLNPITTMYHISPVCLVCLIVPFSVLEAEKLATHEWRVGPALLLLSAAAAFALNCAIFLLIGKTSALTMNIAGVAKDMLLICLSMGLYGSVVTELQIAGYSVALCGAFFFNYQKVKAAQAGAAASKAAASSGGGGSINIKASAMQDSSTKLAGTSEEWEPMLQRQGMIKAAVGQQV